MTSSLENIEEVCRGDVAVNKNNIKELIVDRVGNKVYSLARFDTGILFLERFKKFSGEYTTRVIGFYENPQETYTKMHEKLMEAGL